MVNTKMLRQVLFLAIGILKGVLALDCYHCLSHISEEHCRSKVLISVCEHFTEAACITLYHKIGGVRTWSKLCGERSVCREPWPCGNYASECNVTCCNSIDCNVKDNSSSRLGLSPIYSLTTLLWYFLL